MNGRFYLTTAEGQWKCRWLRRDGANLGMIAQLIATGSLLDKGCLF